VGRTIDARGGRPVLATGALLLAAGLALLAAAPWLWLYLVAWLVLGAGMGACLYDAAFSTLGRLYGSGARGAITALTLWGGFASTVCWPLSALLVESVGWRGTCLGYAALHLTVTLPLCLWLVPREESRPRAAAAGQDAALPFPAPPAPTFLLLAAILTTAGGIAAVWSVHLIAILQAGGLGLAAAVGLGALVGPAQVGARIVEMMFGSRYHPIWTLAAAGILIAIGLVFLWTGFRLPSAALIAYGAGNGIWSIARGTLPLALFGPTDYAVLMGRLAAPSLLAQALAPLAGALVMARYGAEATLGAIAALAVANVLGIALLSLLTRPGRAAHPVAGA
jgi:predicted MFS family arabinose efflux permease